MKHLSVANRWNADLIEEKYEIWKSNPESLDADWKAFFEGYELAQGAPKAPEGGEFVQGEASIISAISRYRTLGHTQASINPLYPEAQKNPSLGAEQLRLAGDALKKEYFTGNYLGGQTLKGSDILDRLEKTYCGSIGYEYMHIQDTVKRAWLQSHIEPNLGQPQFSKEKCHRILRMINHAEMFENFLHTRYVGQKRFSLEGGETLIAGLDAMLEKCPGAGVKEVVMGMAHRGRLNVLANIMGKSYNFIFKEFTENYIPESIYGDGDVKYHLGFENVHKTESGEKVGICLAANPSHLEIVNPVVEGQARARQRMHANIDRSKVLPVLIHGDAAIAGQGVVAEVLNLSQLPGYTTGGTLHIVVNNQIGFTTSPEEGRSTRYCTDVCKMIDAPIFHVNGDDPLAMAQACELALMYRQEFAEDVVIDLYCYRKHGHNESDEPLFTQPKLYGAIKKHKPVSDHLVKRMISEGTLTQADADAIKSEFMTKLDEAFETVKKEVETTKKLGKRISKPHLAVQRKYSFEPPKTSVTKKALEKVARVITSVPEDFKANSKILRQMKTKWEAFENGEGFDWGFAESLAYGTLLDEGTPIRLSGQDSERGTFSHRHAVLYDPENHKKYTPLKNISDKQATFCVHNSCLSEIAVLGFDYGYSLDYPQMLCIWEAQFGDFANGAQVVIDQFIASSESKWQLLSGITLLLPHGYEGQGPEHSSARLERFLQACAEENIQVANVTTPAQIFHLLRKQKKQAVIKPLVIMSPKSLLRHKLCVSKLEDFTKGQFHHILDDNSVKKADRVVFCSGKVYYDLLAEKEAEGHKNTALVRIEQLYPLDTESINKVLSRHKGADTIVWCQEEPENMGAWSFIAPRLQKLLGNKQELKYCGRKASASPATGSLALHKVAQAAIVEEAFKI